MAEKQYAYAVGRIRYKELSLLNTQDLEQLLAAKSYKECLQLLHDKGWGSPDSSASSEQILADEREKTWNLMRELVSDMSVFDVFLYENDYHNLKAAIKLVYSGQKQENVFINNGTIEPQIILKAIKDHDYDLLPPEMRDPARNAFQTLLHTGDGQRCDFILDKASLEAVYFAGKAANNEVLKKVTEIMVATADIKIAVRSYKTGKSLEMITLALANCDSLDIQKLARAATENEEAIYEYLGRTAYAKAVEILKESLAAFERWCDNMIIAVIRPQKYNPFTIGPLAAYIFARQNEIKSVRMILSGKLNELPEESIRERLRDMYV